MSFTILLLVNVTIVLNYQIKEPYWLHSDALVASSMPPTIYKFVEPMNSFGTQSSISGLSFE